MEVLKALLHLVWICYTTAGGRHESEIMQQPNDVIRMKCGKDARMTCVAKAQDPSKDPSPPDTQWWYRTHGSLSASSKLVVELERENRVAIEVEEFVVIRTTLVVKDLKLSDQGVYQCRASKSPQRYDEGVNVYQHWEIEEAIIDDLNCGQVTTTTPITHVIPSTSYNRSRFDDIITTTMSSYAKRTKSSHRKPSKGRHHPSKRPPPHGNKRRHPQRSTAPTNMATGAGSSRHHCHVTRYLATALLVFIYSF